MFSIQTLKDAPEAASIGMIAILFLAVGLDLTWSRMRKARSAQLGAAP